MKYIMLEQELKDGMLHYVPVIFPNGLVHSDVSESLIELANKTFRGQPFKVVSAGEVRIDSVRTSGNSETLNLESSVLDSLIINTIDYRPFYDFKLHKNR